MFWGLVVVGVLVIIAALVNDVYALTAEEYQLLEDEQESLQTELVLLKEELKENQHEIIDSNKNRADLRNTIVLLRQSTDDQLDVFAYEAAMFDETERLRELRVERIALLDKQSEIKQRINSINDDLRYGVTAVDESEVKLVSSETINIQINIDDLTERLELTENIIDGIDDEIKENVDQVNLYKRIGAQYQAEYENVKEQQKTSWLAVTQFETSKQLADSFNTTVKFLEERRDILKEKRKEFVNQKQTLITVIETNQQALILADEDFSNQKKLVGVQLSGTCLTLVKNNFTTNCPTYDDLIVFDTSLLHVTGEFTRDENGFLSRTEPPLNNSWRYYQYDDELRLIVDPPLSMSSRMPMIIIENNLGRYDLPGYNTVNYDMMNQTRSKVYHADRYIDRCLTATISADEWGRMLTDTAKMLRTGCTETTIQDKFEEPLPITEIDITTSPFWQYTQWLESSKNACKTICKQY